MAFSFITCSYCSNRFIKDNRHINENIKLGNNFYCSPICQYSAKRNSKELICENPKCKNKFRRGPSAISLRNFCSRACYGTLVALRNKASFKSFKYCKYCGTRIGGKFTYCSPKCWGLDHRTPKRTLIGKLQNLANKLGRSPTRRECEYSTACFKYFGSWSNALMAAGLTPHRSLNQRMYKRRKCIAKDGHICNSISELIIDNWLTNHGIKHTKEAPYPKGKFIADWKIFSTLVEYFGLAKDSRIYDEEIKKKQQICKESNTNLIAIYSKDLFPKNNLTKVFQDFT